MYLYHVYCTCIFVELFAKHGEYFPNKTKLDEKCSISTLPHLYLYCIFVESVLQLLVVTTGNHRDVTTGNHRDVTTGTHRDPGEVSHRPQYGRRHHIPSVDSDRDIAHPDYGTYLAQLRVSSSSRHRSPRLRHLSRSTQGK